MYGLLVVSLTVSSFVVGMKKAPVKNLSVHNVARNEKRKQNRRAAKMRASWRDSRHQLKVWLPIHDAALKYCRIYQEHHSECKFNPHRTCDSAETCVFGIFGSMWNPMTKFYVFLEYPGTCHSKCFAVDITSAVPGSVPDVCIVKRDALKSAHERMLARNLLTVSYPRFLNHQHAAAEKYCVDNPVEFEVPEEREFRFRSRIYLYQRHHWQKHAVMPIKPTFEVFGPEIDPSKPNPYWLHIRTHL